MTDLTGKLSPEAAANVQKWLTEKKYTEYRDEVQKLIDAEDWKTLTDNFWQVVPFGTGGRRGTVGVGSNRINNVTMGESAQGFADYVAKTIPNAKARGIVIAYDTRLTSKDFSKFVARVFAANDFHVYLFDNFRPTPELSFAVRHLQAAAGVVISASHNPASDNGFKAYWEDGGQIVPPHDQNIIDIASHVAEIKTTDFDQAMQTGKIKIIGEEIDQVYIDAVVNESLARSRSARIVYSPLHGTGQVSVLPVLQKAGFKNIALVEEQMPPDGNFPNIAKNIPNPELPETAGEATELAKKLQADFALTTDPDADRLGLIPRDREGNYQFLTGNQIAALACYHTLKQMRVKDKLTPQHFIVRTIVTTDLLDALAADFDVKIYNHILIGFKYVAELIRHHEDTGGEKFLFGGEESFGSLKGSYARDKDAAVAALLVAELASALKDEGKTLIDQLHELYRQYGLFWEKLTSIFYEGAEGGAKMVALMKKLRSQPPAELAGLKVTGVIDRLDPTYTSVGQGDVLIFNLSKDNHTRVTIRPSGTEPKVKIYTQLHSPLDPNISDSDLEQEKQQSENLAQKITADLQNYTELI